MPTSVSKAVTTANKLVIDCRNRAWNHPLTVTLKPGGGGTLLMEASNTPNASTDPETANWVPHPDGAVSSMTEQTRYAPCQAIRFTATTANGVVEIQP